MAMRQLPLEGSVVKKSNALARARWSAESVWEPRLVALLASKVKQDDEDFQTYEIPITELIAYADKEASGKTYQELTKIIDNLMGRILTIYDEKGWTKYTVFSKCRYISESGMLELRFDPDLKPHYLQLQKNFVKYNLLEFLTLPSIYSQRLFEILKSWDDKPEIEIPIKELHDMLDVPESLRANFKDFRRRVLEKAHNDITSLEYEWEPIKKGRAVTAIRFIFAKKLALPVAEKKRNDAQKAESRAQNKSFNAAIACYQERGANCRGGAQNDAICALCRHIYPRNS